MQHVQYWLLHLTTASVQSLYSLYTLSIAWPTQYALLTQEGRGGRGSGESTDRPAEGECEQQL